ncbi:hypothetical protein BB558_006130 [Smittium angustum]|nr:hypothetical protein BB558_006130 [Smittium angustum]
MGPKVKKGDEESVCRTSVVMSHLADISVKNNDYQSAKRWARTGDDMCSRFPGNQDCSRSHVSFVYANGFMLESENRPSEARVEYRKALELSKAMGFPEGEFQATNALARTSTEKSSIVTL